MSGRNGYYQYYQQQQRSHPQRTTMHWRVLQRNQEEEEEEEQQQQQNRPRPVQNNVYQWYLDYLQLRPMQNHVLYQWGPDYSKLTSFLEVDNSSLHSPYREPNVQYNDIDNSSTGGKPRWFFEPGSFFSYDIFDVKTGESEEPPNP